mgnify:CR=1 FL=1
MSKKSEEFIKKMNDAWEKIPEALQNEDSFIRYVFGFYVNDDLFEEGNELDDLFLPQFGTIQVIQNERINDLYKIVLFIKNENFYLEIDIPYNSYEGCIFKYHQVFEVEPEQVMITRFNLVN